MTHESRFMWDWEKPRTVHQCSRELKCPGGCTGSDPHIKARYTCYNMHLLSNGYLMTTTVRNHRNGEQSSFLAGDSLVACSLRKACSCRLSLVPEDLEYFLRLFPVGCKAPSSSCLSLGSYRHLPLVCPPQQAASIHTQVISTCGTPQQRKELNQCPRFLRKF